MAREAWTRKLARLRLTDLGVYFHSRFSVGNGFRSESIKIAIRKRVFTADEVSQGLSAIGITVRTAQIAEKIAVR